MGNFDGLHLGHQSLLKDLVAYARHPGGLTTVLTFEPMPQEYFIPNKAPPRLTRLREKVALLSQWAIDQVAIIPFRQAVAQMEAESFVDRYLVRGLGIRHLVIGDDFRFGVGRRGDIHLLTDMGKAHGFTVSAMKTFLLDGERVSSTRIRQVLSQGDFTDAERLLGYPYQIHGRVVHGNALGHQLGFPTANLRLTLAPPLTGVYAVKVFGIQGKEACLGVANVGYRPTLQGRDLRLEVHLLDFDGDLYGQHIKVFFIKQLRAEQKFNSLSDLQWQIKQDVIDARGLFQKW